MLSLEIDDSAIEEMIGLSHATDKHIETARVRTLRKMRKRIETRVKQRVATQERIPQHALSDRFFTSAVQPGDEELKIWIGTWAIEPFSMGTPTQNSKGVRSARRSYPGAFIASIYGGMDKVWIRLHSKHYSPALYPTRRKPGDRGLSGLRGRFPVVRAAIPIDGAVKNILEIDAGYNARLFETIFQRELNYEVNVKGANA